MALMRLGYKADFTFRADGRSVDTLRVESFHGTESISRPFFYRVQIASPCQSIDLTSMIGKPAVFKIAGSEGERFVHGLVLRIEQRARTGRFTAYEVVVVPDVYLLAFRKRSRIFQKMTVPEIVKQVLDDSGIASDRYRFSLKGTYPKREYCVQYRESHLDFISRLLEDEGIFYFFEHTESGHVLVLADTNAAAVPVAGGSELPYVPPTGELPETEHVIDFRLGEEFRSGSVMLADFFYEKATTDLSEAERADLQAEFEDYDYPGGYFETQEGKRLAKTRLEEIRATRVLGTASTTCRRLLPGYRFKLTEHPRTEFNAEYLVTNLRHSGSQPQVREEETTAASQAKYESTVEFIPSKTVFRPARVTPKPLIHGVQTATVVGPGDEKIYLDDLGRAKVQFHWDREGKRDENATCWVRVSQGYAGPTHGIQFPPLVGDEVVVDFVEGDPDRPLITGRVYNSANKPPLDPAKRIQNIVLTPYQHRVLLDDNKACVTINTGGSETIHLGDAEQDQDFGNNVRISTKDGHYLHLAKGDRHKGLMVETEAKHKLEIRDDPDPGLFLVDKNGTIYLHLDTQNKTINVINDAQGEIDVKVEGGKVNVAGATITVEAEDKLVLKAGTEVDVTAPTVKVKGEQAVEISGMQTKVEGQTQLQLSGTQATLEAKATGEVKGGALLNIQAALVKIN